MTKNKPTYQELNDRLQQVLDQLQSHEITIDDALQLQKEGEALIAQMQKMLEAAENTIKKLPKTA